MTGPLLAVGRRVRQRHIERTLDALGNPTRILDAGCGEGRILEAMADRWPNARILGIDMDDEVLGSARTLLHDRPGVEIRQAAIGEGSLGERFDLIVSVDVMEHIADDEKGFRWLADHMAPGGTLVLHVPASPQRHIFRVIDRAIEAEVAAGEGPHLRDGYDPGRCRALLTANGLEPQSMQFTFHRGPVRFAEDIDSMLYMWRLKPLKAILLPALLAGAAAERRPSENGPGYGLLTVAQATA